MKLAPRLKLHLDAMGIGFDVRRHLPTATSSATAEAARVPGAQLAKAVLLTDAQGPVLAVLASTRHVDLARLESALGRKLDLASEAVAAGLFFDCQVGAIPPTGAAYGIDVVLDEGFGGAEHVFLEAGDHQHLLRIGARDFDRLMRRATRASFAVPGPGSAAEPTAKGDPTARAEPAGKATPPAKAKPAAKVEPAARKVAPKKRATGASAKNGAAGGPSPADDGSSANS